MKQSTTMMLGAGALLGTLAFTPTFAEILVESSDDDRNVYILLDREASDGEITREYYDGSVVSIDEENTNGHILRMMIDDGDTVSTCVRLELDGGDTPLTCMTSTDRGDGDRVFFQNADRMPREVEIEVRQAMLEHEHDMVKFEHEMVEFEREMAEFEREMSNIDWGVDGLAETLAEVTEVAAHIQESVMASLAENGVRIESDSNGNDTVWVDGGDDASMRVVSGEGGSDLVFMYFDGFDRPYHYVIEDDDRDDDSTTIHAFDVSTVEIRESNNRQEARIETETMRDGRPHLIVHTDNPDHVRVVRLDRRRFDG